MTWWYLLHKYKNCFSVFNLFFINFLQVKSGYLVEEDVKTVTRQIKERTQPIIALRMAKAAEGISASSSESGPAQSTSQQSMPPPPQQDQSSQPLTQVSVGENLLRVIDCW